MIKRKNTILILGATGMVGRTVYSYLSENNDFIVIGTSRKRTNQLLPFDAHNITQLEKIVKKYNIKYIINCIGILPNFESSEELIYINSLFPHFLESSAQKTSTKLIHISTDAVFSDQQKIVHEQSHPNPMDLYGASKWLGETSTKSSITIRSSFLGLDPNKKHGILEWLKTQKKAKGFISQQWSGCTTLQFATLCEYIIENNKFNQLRNNSHIYHFVPLGPTNKYTILKEFIKKNKLKISLAKSDKKVVKRTLTTIYFDILKLNSYTNNVSKALEDLITFEESVKNTS